MNKTSYSSSSSIRLYYHINNQKHFNYSVKTIKKKLFSLFQIISLKLIQTKSLSIKKEKSKSQIFVQPKILIKI